VNIVLNMSQTLGNVRSRQHKVKLEGGFTMSPYVDVLYGEPPKINFDRCVIVSRK
jgi:hypothetical protein